MTKRETVKNVTYSNGNRVTTVEQIATRAEDFVHLGQLYIQMGDMYRRLDDETTTEETKGRFTETLETIKAEVELYKGYIDGYGV